MLLQLEGTFCLPDGLFGWEEFMGKEKKTCICLGILSFHILYYDILEVELDIKSLMHTALKCMKCEL